MNLSENSKQLMKERYCRPGEVITDVFPRVAKEVNKASKGNLTEYLNMMESLDFLPNSPCLKNAGGNNQLRACFVLPIHDSMSSIFKTLQQSAQIFKSGGGVGYNFSELREKDSLLDSGGTSSGVMSFMKIYNSITEAIKQGGMRRGASMGVLNHDHPQILDFVTDKAKNNSMNNFNLSVLVTDQFMKGIKTDSETTLYSRKDRRNICGKISNRDLFNIICYNAWLCGDPGMLFFERINADNPYYPEQPIVATNPCGEVPLLPFESCNLGSINLSKFISKSDIDYSRLETTIENATEFLLSVNKLSQFPQEISNECHEMIYKYNRIGLGVMGFADLLISLNIPYDSKETLSIIDKIGRRMKRISHRIANTSVATLSIAPTGSLSIIANCSSGIEPIFSSSYTRNITIGNLSESRNSPYLRTAHQVSPEWHLKIQARWQKYIDNGVSKTVNLPNSASISDIQSIYLKAWKMKCKGITVYRDNSRSTQIYNKCSDDQCIL